MNNAESFPASLTSRQASPLASWLMLSHLRGMTSPVFNRLLEVFHSPEHILDAGTAALLDQGVNANLAEAITRVACGSGSDEVVKAVDRCLAWEQAQDHHILTTGSPAYPALLQTIPDPPPLLFVAGDVQSLHLPMIAMVGSRHPSADGRRHARRFARDFSAGGIGVISGLAQGIDAQSHHGALQGGSPTVGVLGTGIDRIYPARNADLYEQILGNGALVSEFTPGTPPVAANFPKRNRIISGLSVGVLVVEASLKSGSMITARFALEQGRGVYAIPGSIDNPMARGCHKLITQGAKLVEQVTDVVEDCRALLGCFTASSDTAECAEKRPPTGRLSADMRKLLSAIGYDPVPLDQLVSETGLEAGRAAAAMMEMELLGLVRTEAGGYVHVTAE